MATLTCTIRKKIPLGRDWMVMLRTSALSGSFTSDTIPAATLGLRKIRAAFATGAGTTGDTPSVVINSADMANAEDTAPGALAICGSVAQAAEVWIIGRGKRGSV